MKGLRLRQVAIKEMLHPRPGLGRTALLTAATQLMEPELGDFGHELIQTNVVVGDGVVSKPSANHTRQPAPGFADTVVLTCSPNLYQLQ